jgi:hypothetical protein
MWHAWERKMNKALVGKPEGKRPLDRPRHRREDGIRMDLREIAWGMWSGFNLLRTVRWWDPVNVAMNLWVLAPWSTSLCWSISKHGGAHIYEKVQKQKQT